MYCLYTFEKCAEQLQYLMKFDNFLPFGRIPSGKATVQVMADFVVSNTNTKTI